MIKKKIIIVNKIKLSEPVIFLVTCYPRNIFTNEEYINTNNSS